MNPKAVIKNLLLLFLGACLGGLVVQAQTDRKIRELAALTEVDQSPTPSPTAKPARLALYYFHADKRCDRCNRLEQLAHAALQQRFAAQLQSGAVEWRVLNRQSPENAAYVERYDLTASGLVAQRLADGRPGDWKVLARAWDELKHDDEGRFADYIEEELGPWLNPPEATP